jgi:ribonuclease VapC
MIIDSSTIVAVFCEEPEAETFLATMVEADEPGISSGNALEAGIVLSHRKGRPMHTPLKAFLDTIGIEVIPFDEEHWAVAMAAWWRYGKTRSRAKLNFGDCIAYATASLADRPLLCKGEDFKRTDIALVTGNR